MKDSTDKDLFEWVIETTVWLEGLEKELRARLAIIDFKLVLTRELTAEKRTIKEVLGEETKP